MADLSPGGGGFSPGQAPTTTKGKKKKKEEKVEVRPMEARLYFGGVRTTTVGEKFLEGTGVYTWEDEGIKYEGPFKNSQIIGRGKAQWKDGRVFEGDFLQGKRHGQGTFISADAKSRYTGGWVNGLREGEGKMIYGSEGEMADVERVLGTLSPDKAGGGGGELPTTPMAPESPDGIPHSTKNSKSPAKSSRAAARKGDEEGDPYADLFVVTADTCYYEGQWKAGKKHGAGIQQWRRGVVYEGTWQNGVITGHGKMIWKEQTSNHTTRNEEYRGQWVDNLPHGNGVHIWHSLDVGSTLDGLIDRHASQQANNKYEGQWRNGVRHGLGTFSYANGSKYRGTWKENKKEDARGRHTFEDGSVYVGPFINDRMVNYTMNNAVGRTTLNIGGEDNPVRQCIDIADLTIFTQAELEKIDPRKAAENEEEATKGRERSLSPPGRGKKGHAQRAVQPASKKQALTGIYNMLLRYLTEMKQIYFRYRKVLKTAGDDPFLLTTMQFWCFARDFKLLTPQCSMAKLNRWLLSGPRRHCEACPEDFEVFEAVRAASARSLEMERQERQRPKAEVQAPERNDSKPKPADPGAPGAKKVNKKTLILAGGDGAPFAEENFLSGELGFYRKNGQEEKASEVVSIHSPGSILLFRHFMEGLVRLACARFPYYNSLEEQLERMFKECIVPNINNQIESIPTFELFKNEEFLSVMAKYEERLQQLFLFLSTGHGMWGNGVTGNRRSRRGFPGASHRANINHKRDVTIRFKDYFKLLDHCGLIQPEFECSTKVMNESIFPRPEDEVEEEKAGPGGEKKKKRNFFLLKGDDLLKDDPSKVPGQQKMNWPSGLDMILGQGGGDGGEALSGLNLNPTALLSNKKAPVHSASAALTDEEKKIVAAATTGEDPSKPPEEEKKPLQVFSEIEDVYKFDWQCSIEDVLMTTMEVLSPSTTYQLRYEMTCTTSLGPLPVTGGGGSVGSRTVTNPSSSKFSSLTTGSKVAGASATQHSGATNQDAAHSNHEFIKLLDYLETEMTYIEFQRAFFELSKVKTRCNETGENLWKVERFPKFDTFMECIFIPSLEEKYVPPAPEEEEPVKEEEKKEEEENEDQENEEQENEEVESKQDIEEDDDADTDSKGDDKEPQAEETIFRKKKHWKGVEDDLNSHEKMNFIQDDEIVKRHFPKNYLQQVSEWN